MNNKKSYLVWILSDKKSNVTESAVKIAENLGYPYLLKNISYNWRVYLPRFIKNKYQIKVTSDGIFDDLEDATFSKIIISTTEKNAIVALNIKRTLQDKVFLIHIGKLPKSVSNEFDMVLLFRKNSSDIIDSRPNVVEIIGKIDQINPEQLKKEAKACNSILTSFPNPKVALFIEDVIDTKNNMEEFGRLARAISRIINNIKGSLLVSVGKKISPEIRQHIKDNLSCTNYFYYQADSINTKHGRLIDNHYLLPYLALAKYLIVVGDSVSICSKCCSSGKPVYWYGGNSANNLEIYKKMLREGYIIQLDLDAKKIGDSECLILDEARRVTELIKENI